jgi:hypothetical protein
VLGPLLYILYTYDLPSVIRYSKFHLYADDLQIYIHFNKNSVNTAVDLLNKDISAVADWCEKHGLQINPSKSQSIIFGTKKQISNLNLDSIDKCNVLGHQLDYSARVKNLGVVMDSTLSWSRHVSALSSKIYCVLRNLYRFRSSTKHEVRVKLARTLAMPIIDYCNMLLTDMSAEEIRRLQVVQNNIVRYIFNLKKRQSITPFYKELQWLKVKERVHLSSMIQIFKTVHNYGPSYLKDFFKLASDTKTRGTRSHPLSLQLPRSNCLMFEQSIPYNGVRMWNSLPSHILNSKSIAIFKKRLTAHLITKSQLNIK